MAFELSENKTRINFVIDKELLLRLDEYAKTRCLSRSGAICSLVSEILEQKVVISQMPELTRLYSEMMKGQKE
jgi:metal-responsive CopG/Arc/MetJ family transcriptional regulator